MRLLLPLPFLLLIPLAETAAQITADESEVLRIEEVFRTAKANKDAVALSRILSDDYYGVNQYGAWRDKSQLLSLFTYFDVSLAPAKATVHITDDVAIATGSQSERNPAGNETLLFTRVYIKRGGRWLLFSSSQNSSSAIRNNALPKTDPVPSLGSTQSEVLTVEEAFRRAKMAKNTAVLDQIIDEHYSGVNQYGSRRGKSELIELFKEFPVTLTPPAAQTRISDNVAIVAGTQTEENPGGTANLKFHRVYVKRNGAWRLLASSQIELPTGTLAASHR